MKRKYVNTFLNFIDKSRIQFQLTFGKFQMESIKRHHLQLSRKQSNT